MTERLQPFKSHWNTVFLCIILTAIYLPIVMIVLFSFNDSKRGLVWRGFSWRHYQSLLDNESLLTAFSNSILLACANALLATLLGLAAALSLERFRFSLVSLYAPILVLPLVIPEICLGLALLVFFHAIGWPLNLPWPWSLGTVLVSHVTFSLPFAALVIRARLRQLNPELELAAHDLGASEWLVLTRITLPQLQSALIAAALLSFTLSLDDFVVTFFTAGPYAQLLPVKVFSMIRFGSTPQVNAVSSILVLLTFVGIALATLSMRRR